MEDDPEDLFPYNDTALNSKMVMVQFLKVPFNGN